MGCLDWGPYSGLTAPSRVPRDSFTLTYGSTTVTLPAPEFGDRKITSPRVIKRELLDLELKVCEVSSWEEVVLEYKFDNVKREDSDAYLAFLLSALGQLVSVTDHNTITFNAIILNPDSSVTYSMDNCSDKLEIRLRWLP